MSLGSWDDYDVDFVGKCVAEFDRVDPKGFAFRYYGEGAEVVRTHFSRLEKSIPHVHQVLEGLRVSLAIIWSGNGEWPEPLDEDVNKDEGREEDVESE